MPSAYVILPSASIIYSPPLAMAYFSTGYAVPVTQSYHPKAVARLRAHMAGDGYERLMTADGHKVTMPLYWEIEALGHELYLCSSKNGDKLIVVWRNQNKFVPLRKNYTR